MKELIYDGFNDYFITKFGEIYSNRKGCLIKLKPFLDSKKHYYMIRLINSKTKQRKSFLIHRIVAEHFISNPYNLLEVNHKNYNSKDNFYKNLEWVTRIENIPHSLKKHSPIRNYKTCKLYYNQEFFCNCNSIKEATEIAYKNWNISKSSLIKYLKSKNVEIKF